MKKLENKTAVVTGGNSGIGFATARELIAQGAKVLITGRKQNLVDNAAKEIGATGIVSDQSNLKDIDTLVAKTKSQFGKVDILFVNAGTIGIIPFESVTEDFYNVSMDINLKGVFFTVQKFLPILSDNASIVLMSAGGTKSTGAMGTSVYYLSRAAINSLVRSLTIELAPRGIRINAILPAAIETPIFSKIGLPAEALPQLAALLKDALPLKKMGTAADVANLVAFLSSDSASFINGSEYMIDGGLARKPLF